ncbi:hypothetical protein [Nocardioides mesophilus]|uniref:Uncharacterized protein n=1 Tax=Nocardioides mesophilus TaxID=433659 RepID=A0A7G9R9P0_9ACTN|nr:hypothetical protein [Nocardioides mesophilus]QNN52315.1 hypothetical protein H9L09_17795 [Nocardioides mesophilus]
MLVGAGVSSIGSMILLLRARGTTNEQPYELIAVDDESAQVPAYLLAFVFPFVFVTGADWRDAVAYGAFAVLVGLLVLRTDLVLVQPVLLAAGYHLYKVQTTSGFGGIMLSSVRPQAGQTIHAVRLSATALKLTIVQP